MAPDPPISAGVLMKVVQLTGYDGPYAGSFIPMVRAAMDAASARGWEVEAVFPEQAREREWAAQLEAGGTVVHYLERGSRATHARQIGDLLAGGEPAVFHSHFTLFDIAAAAAARGRLDTALFWHLHSRPEPGLKARVRNLVKFAVVGRSAEILCVAPNIADGARARGARASRVRFFANAIDTSRFPIPDSAERTAARSRLGLDPHARVLMHFGWDWHRKGGDLFLEAVGLLEEPGTVAVTVGGGDEARELARRLGVADRVVVLDPRDDAATLHAAADVFVSCSRAEGMPFAMAEALSSGVAVAATDIPGQVLIGNEVPGCRLTPADPAKIAAAIRDLLARDPGRMQADSLASHRAIAERMGLPAWAERLVDLYEAALPSSV